MSSEVRITDPKTGGQKGQKAERYDLFPYEALDEVARVYAFGAKKYADDNWLKGYSWRLSLGALIRHVARFASREDRDPESGLHHLAHAVFHCLTLITFGQRGGGTDDRMAAMSPVECLRRNAMPVPAPTYPQVGDVVEWKCLHFAAEIGTVTKVDKDQVYARFHQSGKTEHCDAKNFTVLERSPAPAKAAA